MSELRGNSRSDARDALEAISSDLPRDEWVRMGMAAHAAGLEFDDFNRWSAEGGNYSERDARDAWRSFKLGKGIGAGTLFKTAAENGWRVNGKRQKSPDKPFAGAAAAPWKPRAGMSPAEVWERSEAATESHPYIRQKRAGGVPMDALRVLPVGDPLRIAGEPMAGALVLPVTRADGTLSSLQFIAPPEVSDRLKAAGKPNKLNLPGARMEGWFAVGELVPGGVVYVCEGIGQAWACWQATGNGAVACFGWGRVRAVVTELRGRDSAAALVLVPDVGKQLDAEEIARDVNAAVACMPEGWPDNSDVNDLAQRDGLNVLEALLKDAKPSEIKLPLSVVFADELPDTFTPPDELVEGLLITEDSSVAYGDTNSGKTFFIVDLGAAVARGVPWMGRKTEPGLVVYLAAESPASVGRRLQAYQKHHGVLVPNFAIVQSPIDLFDGDADTAKVIQLVRQLEAITGQKARLIVGDTFARLSAGANENAGQDMGLVVRRIDRIRA
jgi:putative DNA primase/helicase